MRDVHLLDFLHVLGHLFDGHLVFFLIDQALDLLKFDSSDATKSAQAHVTDLFEDKIVLIGQSEPNELFRILALSLSLSWIDDLVGDACVARGDAKRLVDLSLVVLLDAER